MAKKRITNLQEELVKKNTLNEGRYDKICRTEDRKSNLSIETRFTGNGNRNII